MQTTPNRPTVRGFERSFRLLFALVAFVALTARAHAQLPVDNNVYKTRCALLASAEGAIQNGAVPAALIAATRGVPAIQFETFAFERASGNNHNVACTLFYLAAVAARAGNGGKPDSDAAHSATTLAQIELHTMQGQSLSMSEHIAQMKAKVGQMSASSLTSAQLLAVVNAVSTLPLSLEPPANQQASLNKPSRR